jgi:GH18 family chitinase
MKIRKTTLLLIALAGVCSAQVMPTGWTKPASKLTRQDFRQKDPNHFLVVTGDFNGDGVQDKAMLLVNQRTQKLGFFVCLTTETGCDWHRLEVMDIAFLDVMGIAKVKPGQYDTACGKGYWECGKDEPEKLSTKRDAVEFFKDESASSVYVYNPKTRKFISIATSD